MKRLVIILLLALLPTQMSWGVAAVYCQHKAVSNDVHGCTSATGAGCAGCAGAATAHFGHHAHQHQIPDQHQGDAKKKPGVDLDGDHALHHHPDLKSCVMKLPDFSRSLGSVIFPKQSLNYSSHIPDGLERPNQRLIS